MGRGIEPFNRGDSVVLPSNFSYTLVESTQDLELLEVTLPDIVETRFTWRLRALSTTLRQDVCSRIMVCSRVPEVLQVATCLFSV